MTETTMGTFAEYLRPLAPHLPPQLISAQAFESLQRTAQLIPGALAMSMFGFECRLADPEALADLHLCASAAFNARQTLAQTIASGNMLIRNHPIWQRIYDFVESWSYEGSALNLSIRNAWLEFDTASSATEVPAPSLYFSLSSDAPSSRNNLGVAAVCLKALALLKGRLVPGHIAARITGAIMSLPPSASPVMVGAMQARKSPACRLVIQGLDRESIPAYLEKIEWPRPLQPVETLLADTSPFSDYLYLTIDIGETIYPRIGWECYYDGMSQPATDARWVSYLDYLVGQGICLPSKRDALLTYPGVISASASGSLWPESLRLLSKALGAYSLDRCTADLHHIKIDYHPDRGASAKAYLCAYYE